MASCNFLKQYVGEDFTITFQMCCTTSTSEYPDVTGWNTCFHCKRNSGDTGYVFAKTGTIVCSTGGKLSVTVDSSDTATIGNGIYYHDFWRVDLGGLSALSEGPYQIHWSLLYT